jgi:mediator of RNA polymerase II transcription subunit 13
VATNLANDGTKGGASPNIVQARGPSTARLRKAEHEIRKLGILVSSDTVKHELFTFFRRADIQRDAKTIFSRLAAVLRSNVCTISEKKAARASDMLHLENGRLYRLFISALTLSIRSMIVNSKGLIPCGMATFVAKTDTGESPQDYWIEPDEENAFRLLDMDMQLLPSGHLLLWFRPRRSVRLSQPKHYRDDPKVASPNRLDGFSVKSDCTLVLAPSGQTARRGRASPAPEAQGRLPPDMDASNIQSPLLLESRKREIWEAMVENWLANQGIELQSSGQEIWLDVELPVRTVTQSPVVAGSPDATSPQQSVMWQSFRWPASLCFDLAGAERTTPEFNEEENGMDDPLSFAEDWFRGAEARAKSLEERRSKGAAMEELRSQQQTESEAVLQNPLFASPPTFHRHPIGDVSMGQHIYPTPPDGPVSQVTPGMSSMDGGVIATPADQNQQLAEASQKHDDEDMQDAEDAQQGDLTIGTGQYDEDLFGDIPVETFGPSGIADEPNWDFFDEPDLEMVTGELASEIPDEGVNNHSLNPGPFDSAQISSDIPADTNPPAMVHDPQNVEQDVNQIEHPGASSDKKADLDSPKSEENHLRDKDPNGDSTASTMSCQRQPLTGSDVRQAVADSIRLGHYTSKHHAECSAGSEHGINRECFVDVVRTGQGKPLSDAKYSTNGRFWFGNDNFADINERPRLNVGGEIPKIGLLQSSLSSEMPTRTFDGTKDAIMVDATQSESLSSAEHSDVDSGDFLSNPNEPTTPSADPNREWTKYVPGFPEHPEADVERQTEQGIRDEFGQLLEQLRIDDGRATLPVYEQQNPESVLTLTSSTHNILIAQILVDQLTQSSLYHGMFSMPKPEDIPLLDCDISKELSESYGTAEHVTLQQLACVSSAGSDDRERISKLGETYISIYREGRPLTALSTILPFWDALGLQPASGRKNITALCIHPHGSNVRDGCRVFIDRLGEIYENCYLGDHKIGRIAGTTNDGLVAWSATDNSLPDLSQTCERVGTALSRLPATDDNIMIYMIVPNGSDSHLLMIFEGFMALWSAYMKTCGKKQPNELALQLIPMSFVALPDTLATPAQSEYLTLAIEVYNRCPPANFGDEIAYCGSAVVLAERECKQPEFDITTTVQSPFEKNGKALHLAYSQSKDNRWICAAWTDSLGRTALTMSYSLRQRGSGSSRSISEVIKELWEISVDLMQKIRTRWRLVVVKQGRLTAPEANNWVILANQDVAIGRSSRHTLVLLSIDCEPSLSLRLPVNLAKQVHGVVTQQPSGLYGTPVSTPQASTTSPDQTTMATPTPGGSALNAPTPPEHNFDPNAETDLSLSDPSEGTWSGILSHGVSQAKLLEARPALASGYMLKRRGTSDPDTVVAIEVNIIYTAISSPAERQDLLKEILSQYKDLVTLAKTRGMIDSVDCILPWHIATAIKGQQALSLIM